MNKLQVLSHARSSIEKKVKKLKWQIKRNEYRLEHSCNTEFDNYYQEQIANKTEQLKHLEDLLLYIEYWQDEIEGFEVPF